MAHVQQRIRENSMELQDYLRELKDWEAKAKAKDRVLRGGATSSSDASDARVMSEAPDAPPIRGRPKEQLDVRGSVTSTEQVSEGKEESKKVTRSAASHTYDYFKDKWDKFDVDKALAEADADSPASPKPTQPPPPKHPANQPPITSPAAIPVPAKAKPTSSEFAFSSKRTDRANRPAILQPEAEAPLEHRKVPDAASEKEEGNRLFKTGRYAEALESYGRSLALGPTSVAYANRAMAALKLENFHIAENDCTAAIGLDERYVKAFSRRGRARSHLGKWLEAAEDFEFALRLEPHNKEILKEYSAARAACQREAKLFSSSVPLQIPVRKVPPAAAEKPVTDIRGSVRLKAGTSGREEMSAPDKEQGRGLAGGVSARGRAVAATESIGRNNGQGNGKAESGSEAWFEGTADSRRVRSGVTEVGRNGNGNGCQNGDEEGGRNGNRTGKGRETGNGTGPGMEERRSEPSVDLRRIRADDSKNGSAAKETTLISVRAEDLQERASVHSAHRMPILDVGDPASDSGPNVATEPVGHLSKSETVGLPAANPAATVDRVKESPLGVSQWVDLPPRKDEKSRLAADRSCGGSNKPANASPRIDLNQAAEETGDNVSNMGVTSEFGGDVSKRRPLDVASAAAEKLQRALAENVSAPRTAYEFEAQWKGFKNDTGAKARLLKTLHPAQLAPFFKESLQAPLLCDMLRVVAGELLPGDATFAADLLEGLSTVPRFAMTVMFIGGKDKQSLRHLWDTAATEESIPVQIRERLAACRTKFRM